MTEQIPQMSEAASTETIETSSTETNLTISPDNKETSFTETIMQVADNSSSVITDVETPTGSPATPVGVPFTQFEEVEREEEEEEEDNMSDIPGIRVSMATIIELPSLEEQQRLTTDEGVPTVSEKVIDEMFSSMITLPEEHQIRLSEVPNQQEPQYIDLNEATIDVPPVFEVVNEINEDGEYIEYSEYNEIDEVAEILTSETSVITENTESSIDTIENAQSVRDAQENVQSIPIYDVQGVQVAHDDQSFSIMQNILNDQDIQNAQMQSVQQSMIIDQGTFQTIPSVEILPQSLVQNASGAVQPMDALSTTPDDHVSPPSTLTTPTDNEDAIMNNDEDAQQGVKRSHEDSDQDDQQGDPKRAAYDNGSSRPEYDSGNGSGSSGGDSI